MFKKGYLSQLFPEAAMVKQNGIEGWMFGEDFIPKSTIEGCIFDSPFMLHFDNSLDDIIKSPTPFSMSTKEDL